MEMVQSTGRLVDLAYRDEQRCTPEKRNANAPTGAYQFGRDQDCSLCSLLSYRDGTRD